MCFSDDTTLKEKINAYFIVELIISIISIICPLFFLITIVSHFLIFKNPKKSWNWDELDEETFENSKIKCYIVLIISAIALLLWCLITGLLLIFIIVGPIIIILYFSHHCCYSTILYDYPKSIIKSKKEEINKDNAEENA
jgi:Na+/H+ antiporter NhaC